MRNSTRINRPWAELIQAGHEQNSHRRTWKTLKWAGHGEDMSRSHMSRTRKNTWAQDEQNSQNSQEQNMHRTHMSRTWKETYEKNIKENQMRRVQNSNEPDMNRTHVSRNKQNSHEQDMDRNTWADTHEQSTWAETNEQDMNRIRMSRKREVYEGNVSKPDTSRTWAELTWAGDEQNSNNQGVNRKSWAGHEQKHY